MLLPSFAAVRLRTRLFRWAGLSIAPTSVLVGRVWIGGGPHANLTIGDRTFVNDGVRFDTSAPITIGSCVDIAHDVSFITSSHEIGTGDRRAGASTAEAVAIGDGCWIGAGAIVLPGVTIGVGSIVGAGAVVNRSVPANTVVGGAPARVIRELAPLDGTPSWRRADTRSVRSPQPCDRTADRRTLRDPPDKRSVRVRDV
jgi:acetyltransferase-like isoleucine patch superfamily enzyme